MGGRWGISLLQLQKASAIFSFIRPTNWFEIYFLATGVTCFLGLTQFLTNYSFTLPAYIALTNEIMLKNSSDFVMN